MTKKERLNILTPADFGDDLQISSKELAGRVQVELTKSVAQYLPQIAALLSVLYFALAIVDYFFMPEEIKIQTTIIAFATMVVFALASIALRMRPQSPERVHIVLCSYLIILQLDGIVFTVLTNDLMMSLGVAIMIIGVGCSFASVSWMSATLALLFVSTWAVLEISNVQYSVLQCSLLLLASLFFATVVFHFRRATATQLENFKLNEQKYINKL